eukprot:TRINITY_DN16213_c0_g1_i4.p1 TRINITY_DN16213_c0_g1~~TRINITY_DN16213_c0_g1_i4.p1  ORF type:complete len:371 (+),score=125.49 TRINITY_DN16213_c0_g1_i4:40-1113(+)
MALQEGHTRSQSIISSCIIVGTLLPLLGAGYFLHASCSGSEARLELQPDADFALPPWLHAPRSKHDLCALGLQHPLAYLNLVFGVLVCGVFWLISIVQGSTWLIDPYWTLLPPLIAAYYRCHPRAAAAGPRGAAAAALVLAWSARLTHSYFRREAWRIGAREDWRFADMRRRWPRTFWFTSLFLAYISQWPMLVGITLPLYALHFPAAPPPPLGAADATLLAAAACALTIAYFADTQLYEFCAANARRRARGETPVPVLQTGLWRYSRHPNYVGEQLWWWCVALLGWRVGAPWTMAGEAFNCACMVHVTRLTEARMLATGARADAYRAYTQRTSAWLPLPPSTPRGARAAAAAAKSE